jgi:hypothetical protein
VAVGQTLQTVAARKGQKTTNWLKFVSMRRFHKNTMFVELTSQVNWALRLA